MFWQGGDLNLVEGKAGAACFSGDTGNLGIQSWLRIEMPEEELQQLFALYERLRDSEWISEFAKRREGRFYRIADDQTA